MFIATSYIKQFEHSVFLTGSDSDKMKIIRGISSIDPSISKFEEIIKIKIKEVENLKIKYNAEIDFINSQLEKSNIKFKKIEISESREKLKEILSEKKEELEKIFKLEKSKEIFSFMRKRWQEKIEVLGSIEELPDDFFEIYDRQKFHALEKLQEDLEKVEQEISEMPEKQNVLLQCPSCDEKLKFNLKENTLKNFNLMSGISGKNTDDIKEVLENQIKLKELQKEKERLSNAIKNFKKISKEQILSSSNEISVRKEDIKNFDKSLEKEIPRSSEEIQKEIEEIERKLEIISKNKELERIANLNESLEQSTQKLKSVEKKLESLKRIKNAKEIVEGKMLSKTIELLNNTMKKHLRKVFPSSAISVRIFIDQQKFGMNIFLNNQSYENPSQLSGGEKSRISIALMLSLNEICNSHFIFLDETLSSTHTDLKPEIIKHLKECSSEKSCVVVGHEETEGLYMNVLKL